MAISVLAIPSVLTWANFTTVAGPLVDPADGATVDALTAFNFNLPNLPPRNLGGQLAMADPNVITITPNAQIVAGVAQTPGLLSHEQFHYDVGIVTARALARHLAALRAPDMATLIAAFRDAATLHFTTRVRLIQRRYDIDTRHGTNAHYQRIWKSRMAACLANPRSETIGGFYL